MSCDDRHILSIEDSDEDFLSLCQALKSAGVENPVRRCADSRAARAALQVDGGCAEMLGVALVLLDLNMPGVDGRELLKQFRQRNRAVPVVVLSTSSHPGDIQDCYDAGANAYLVKPFDYDDWQRMLEATAAFWLETAELPSDQGAAR